MTQSLLDRTLAERIRARLREMNMSQAEFGRRMGLGVDATSRRMCGKTRFKADEIPRAAEILDVPAAELLLQED